MPCQSFFEHIWVPFSTCGLIIFLELVKYDIICKHLLFLNEICFWVASTRVVQKLIKTIRTREQISLVKSALEPGFLDLVKDLNGNHVIQRCLQFLSMEDNEVFSIFAFYNLDDPGLCRYIRFC